MKDKKDKPLNEKELEAVQGGRAMGQAPRNEITDAGTISGTNLGDDIRPEPDPGFIDHKRME